MPQLIGKQDQLRCYEMVVECCATIRGVETNCEAIDMKVLLEKMTRISVCRRNALSLTVIMKYSEVDKHGVLLNFETSIWNSA